ncbi:AAA family ATPase [Patescibacteria group bacterium]|nr:AAA family ATPase [Patescibacteria group bacterium]
MTQKNLIIIDGLNGAGKSTVAKLLASKLKRTALISYDATKRLIGDFTPNEEYHRITNYIVRSMAKEYFDHDINVIIESYVPTKEIAQIYTGLAKRKDVKLYYFQLEAPLEIRHQRILQRPLVVGAKKKMSIEQVTKNDAVYFQHKFPKARVIETHVLKPERIVKLLLNEILGA